MTEIVIHDKQRELQRQQAEAKNQTTFYYQIANMKAMKILVLIKISKLNYELEETIDSAFPFYLKTEKGQLHREYQIINYIIYESNLIYKNLNESKLNDSQKESNANNQNEPQSFTENHENEENQFVNLSAEDNYSFSKMMETLYDLRIHLFPLLDQFYKYMLGHERIKKLKYESLINKIKSEIAKLDAHMNEHSDIYAYQNSFLNIVIACELFMGCKFVFEEKFRKSKYSLFNKYEKMSKKPQFQQIYGKTTMCLKQYVPPEFEKEEQESPQNDKQGKKSDQVIPQQILKMSQNILAPLIYESDRNELLYNYFRSVFTQSDHKKNYFPYFWLMFDYLNCTLVEIYYENTVTESIQHLNAELKRIQLELEKYIKVSGEDYGIVGIYQRQNDKHHMVKGVICLGSKNFNELKSDVQSSVELKNWKIKKIDINQENQKRDVQNIWQNTIQNSNYEGIITCSILYI